MNKKRLKPDIGHFAPGMTSFNHTYLCRMVLRILAIILLTAVSQKTMHADVTTTFSVISKNGTRTCFRLEERPDITFDGNTCIIKSSTYSQNYDMAEIEHIRFDEDKTTGTNNPTSDEVMIDLSDKTTVTVRGLTPGHTVQLYSVNGTLLISTTANTYGTATMGLGALPSNAIYIVCATRLKTFKIYR